MIAKLREKVAGYKTYTLLVVAGVVAVVQFLFQHSFGIDALPVAAEIPDLIGQLWTLALGGTLRAAIK